MELGERGKLRPDTTRMYVCDPKKNTKCKKNTCSHFFQRGKCYLTSDPEFAKVPDIPKTTILNEILEAFNRPCGTDGTGIELDEIGEYLTNLVELDFLVLRRDV